MAHDCNNSLALVSHLISGLEQICGDNIGYCLDNQYHALRKIVFSESEFLFGHNLSKRMIKITANKKFFSMPSKPYNTSFKTSKNFMLIWSNPWESH